MKKTMMSLLISTATALSLTAQADVLNTRIFRVDAPAAPGQEHEVLATHDGRVYFVAPGDQGLVEKLRQLSATHAATRLVLDGDRVIDGSALSPAEAAAYSDDFDQPRVANQAFEAMSPEAMDSNSSSSMAAVDPATPASLTAARALGYEPTILNSFSDAQMLFRSERELKHHSQCFWRAQVWSREFETQHNVKSMKVFMFFTERFRHRYTRTVVFFTRPYKWWFHVAPFVYVGNQEYVLDREFVNDAVTLEDWTFHFIGGVEHSNHEIPNPTRGEATCLDAAAYSQFSNDPNPARYCVLRKVPMYYFQPLDVEALDCRAGATPTTCQRTVVSSWIDGQLRLAYSGTKN